MVKKNWLAEGEALANSGRWLDAIACFRNALTDDPSIPEIHFNLGFALQSMGRMREAIAAYRNAVALKADFAQAHNQLGNVYFSLNRLKEAEGCYRIALAASPDLVQAHYNLGLTLKGLNRAGDAEASFRIVCELAPDQAEAWKNLMVVLASQGRTEESVRAFLEYEKYAPPSADLAVRRLTMARYLGDFEREQHCLAQALNYAFNPADLLELSQLLGIIQYFDVTQAQILNLYRRYNELAGMLHAPEIPLLPPRRTRGERIRIGYLSPDFRAHVMGRLMYEVILRHDTEQFEVYLYSLLPSTLEDGLTARFGELAHKFVRLAPWAEAQAAKMIAEDDLDILVDIAGHSAYSRPLILAYKPARMQITHLGYHGAIGLESVDYKLTDQHTDIPGNQDYLVEKLLPMEGCIFPLPRVDAAEEFTHSREAFGIAEDAVVFGEFVTFQKLSPRCLAAWRSILERVPNGVLAFSPSNPKDRECFLRQTAAAGIAPGRVVFIPREGDAALNRARYQLVDIVLDTFPYSGGDTTLAALDMGVPVVTLCGERHSERTSYSILMSIGCRETIAFSVEEFVGIACRLACDSALREKIGAAILKGVAHSGIADMDVYIKNLEKAYRQALDEKGWNSQTQGMLTATELKEMLRHAIGFHQGHQLEDAEQLYRKLLDDQPDIPSVNYLHAKLLGERGNREAAIGYLLHVTARHPRFRDAFQALGANYLAQGESAKAIAAFGEALALQADQPQGLLGLGQALMHEGRKREGGAMLVRAMSMAAADPAIQHEVGVVFQKYGLLNEAISSYMRALILAPSHWEAHFNLGVIHFDRGEWGRAEQHFFQVIKLKPGFELAYHHLGETLFAAGKIEAWLENFRRFEGNAQPSFRLALYGVVACQYAGEAGKGRVYLNWLLQHVMLDGDRDVLIDALEELLYQVLFFDIDQKVLFGLYKRYNALVKERHKESGVFNNGNVLEKSSKIRVGYLSGDFRNHVMGKMTFAVISRHCHANFEIYCYSLADQEDDWTRKFRESSHKFVNLHGMDALRSAKLIAQDNLDILVDLSTHTKMAMPEILALKPARVQVTHIASAGAVGLDAIDFKLTDHFADTSKNQEYLIETLLRMKGCVYPYRHIIPASEHNYSRDALNISSDAVVLGAFYTILKLSPRCLNVWRIILERAPQALLAFSPAQDEAKPGYLRLVAAAGIDPSRVIFISHGGSEGMNQARYEVVDLVLDAFPYGGVNGTLEALDAGVPVVALCGEKHSERTSYSILENLGIRDTVAATEPEYIEIACRIIADGLLREKLKNDIRKCMISSSLIDMEGHTRNLEAAYCEALERMGFGWRLQGGVRTGSKRSHGY